jgi:NAD(P)-dependent dehydrogenase (short-subunit alcohol dehydrogenase family)
MKIAIVTGGSNGIGRSTVQELSKKGIGVIFTYHSNKESADSLVREVEQTTSAKAVALKLDLSQRPTFDDFAQRVKDSLKTVWQRERFDYLVNNGGVGGAMMFGDMTEAYFDQIFDTNFKGPFFLTQRLIGLMEDGGRIVNTSSGAGRIAPPGYSAYGPSKAALAAWTRYLAKELAPRKIRVNAVSPGPVHTNISGGAFDKHPEYIKPLADQTALGRIGVPRDVAGVIVGLLSDDFDWVTAQDIDVSGGFLL